MPSLRQEYVFMELILDHQGDDVMITDKVWLCPRHFGVDLLRDRRISCAREEKSFDPVYCTCTCFCLVYVVEAAPRNFRSGIKVMNCFSTAERRRNVLDETQKTLTRIGD